MFKPFSIAQPFVWVLLIGLLTACDSGSSNDDDASGPDATPQRVTVSGTVQKGPFSQLQVRAYPLDSQGQAGEPQSVEVDGDRYEFQANSGEAFQIEALGTFQDELSGEPVQLNDPLRAVTIADGQPQNINVLTDLVAARFKSQVGPGDDLSRFIGETEKNLMQQLGFEPTVDPGALDLTQVPDGADLDDPNLSLLLLSGAVMDMPRPSGRMPQTYQGMITGLTQGLEPNDLLPALVGMDAAGLYDQIQEAGVITNLPDLTLQPGNSFVCNPDCSWILNAEPSLSIANVSVREATGVADIVLHRNGGVLQQMPAFSVDVTLAAIDAEAGFDYVEETFTLSLAEDERRASFQVALLVDALAENAETFEVQLGQPDITINLRRSRAVVTILDDLPAAEPQVTGQLSLVDACLIGDGPPASPLGVGCAGILAPVDAYALSSPYALALSLALQADCPSASQCSVLLEDWPVALSLLAEDTNGVEQDRTRLGDYLYPADAIYDSTAVAAVPQQALIASLNPTTVIEFLFRAWQNNWNVRLLASVTQGGNTRTARLDIPQLRPLPDTLRFGEEVLTFDPNADASLIPSAGSTCVDGELEVEGTYLLPVSALGQTADVPLTGPVCAELNASGDLPVNLVVTSGELPFDDNALIPVPEMHRVVTEIGLFGLPESRHATALPYLILNEAANTNENFVFRQILTAENLPFGFEINGGHLGPQGIELTYTTTHVLAHLKYDAGDPRASTVQSNSAIYGSARSGSLILRDAGMETTVQFEAGSAQSGWPVGNLSWETFSLTLNNSEPNQSTLDADFYLAQSGDCRTPGCARGSTILHGGQGVDLALGRDGALLGTLGTVGTEGVAWGARTVSDGRLGVTDYAWRRPDDLSETDSATLQLPGFRAPAVAPVVNYLLSHRQRSAGGVITHDRDSQAFRRGNYYPPGLTVGPEIYADATGQPQTGDGQSMGDRTLEVDLGNDTLPIVTHSASKYVLRNGGVTGVFNADPAQLPDSISLYGYPIEFNRFAVRLEDNRMDDYSWVDGGLALAGDAGFTTAFESLSIDCGGQLGAATLADEPCDGDCRLASWRADTRLFDFRFTDSTGQPAPQCSVADQHLTLLQEADFLALDKALMLDVTWSAQGQVERSVLQNQAQYRLDRRNDSDGFPIALTGAELLPPWDDADLNHPRYGTVGLAGKVGVPFWQAFESDIRLANKLYGLDPEPEPSLPLPRDTLLGASPSNDFVMTNHEAIIALAENNFGSGTDYDIDARYEWGNTGFGFQLPVYYDHPDNSDVPQFLGRKWDQDLFVLQANAGIDYITPERTKLSFGASADFDRLQSLRFQVDLNSLASLEKVDDLLMSVGLTNEPVIAPVLNSVAERVQQINDFSQQGIDTVMEAALLAGVERVGEASAPLMPDNQDPFELLAASMAHIRGYPDLLIARLDAELTDPINAILSDQETALRAPLQRLVNELETAAPTDPVSSAIEPDLDTAIATINDTSEQIRTLFDPIDAALADARAGMDQLADWLNHGQLAVAEINRVTQRVTEFSAAQCNTEGSTLGTEADGYLNKAWEHMANLQSVLSVLEGGELLGFLADSVISDPQTQRSMQEVRVVLSEHADYLLTQLSDAETAVRSELCASDIQQLLFEVAAFTNDTHDQLAALKAELIDNPSNALDARLNELEILADTLESTALEPLESMAGALETVRDELATADTYTTMNLTRINTLLFDSTNGRINVLVESGTSAGETDVFSLVFDGITAQLATTRDGLVTALQSLLSDTLPMATMTADQLRRFLVGQIMNAGPIKQARETLNTELVEVQRQVRDDLMTLTDQVNHGIREALTTIESEVNSVLADATAPVRDIPLTSASLDGYGVIAGHELERAHLAAEWTMKPASDGEEGNTFGASLSAVSWSASNKADNESCASPGSDSNLDVTIAAMNLPARVAGSDITLKKVYLGFTLANAAGGDAAFNPIGVNGGLAIVGDIGFSEFVIYDPAFAAGLGSKEVYLGASAGALFSDIQAEVAFLVGKTCSGDVLMELDPEVAQFIPIPDTGFTGAYVRGSASIPVWATGCPLTIGVSADMGSWILAGPPLTVGGLVGGGAYGKVLCVGALRGQVKALATVNTDGDISFVGEGFGVAGAGFCEPASWTSVSRSRRDSWCATGDARFQAGYQNGWSIMDLSTSAVH